MRKMLVIGALALASSLAAAQGPGYGYGAGGGMFAALNLSEDQRDKISAIQEAQRKKSWATMGEVRSEQFKLRAMYGAEKLDADKLVEQQKKVDALRQLAPAWLSGEE